MGEWGSQRKGSDLAEALAMVEKLESGCTRRSCIGSRENLPFNKVAKGKVKVQKVPKPQSPTSDPNGGRSEECFLKAIEIAQSSKPKSLELRATMSLSRGCGRSRQDRHDSSSQMLAEIYGWFTEGFDTKDLQEAKALLGELSER